MIFNKIKLYDERSNVTLSTYIIDDSREMLAGKKRPAVLVCPGGGYISCSDREAEPVALRFNAMGYHAFVLRYSTYNDEGQGMMPKGEMKVKQKSLYPAPMRDIGKAFLEIRKHAEMWRLDTERIAICGFSAGAHNCAMYSVYWHDAVITEFFNEDENMFRPAAAILGYGISDYNLMMGEAENDFAKMIAHVSKIAYLGTLNPNKELLKTVSPALQVSEKTPPMFLWATFEDALVPVENTTRMADALAAKKIPFEVHIFEGGPHGLSLADQSTANSKLELDNNSAKWVDLAEAWLKKRFMLPLNETPFWMDN